MSWDFIVWFVSPHRNCNKNWSNLFHHAETPEKSSCLTSIKEEADGWGKHWCGPLPLAVVEIPFATKLYIRIPSRNSAHSGLDFPIVSIFFFPLNVFNWRIIALQNFVVFLSYINKNQPQVYPCALPPKPPSHHSPYPTLLDVTEPLFEFPESYSKFPLAIYFTYGVVNFHVTLSIHLTLSILPSPMSIGLFSMSVSPLSPILTA